MAFFLLYLYLISTVFCGPYPHEQKQTEPIDCAGRNNGRYVIGCNQHYTRCLKGVAYRESCDDGLFFDSARDSCEPRHRCTLCRVGLDNDPNSIQPSGCSLYDGNVCRHYGCSQHYYCCQDGIRIKKVCPEGLVYDHYRHVCTRDKQGIPDCYMKTGDWYEEQKNDNWPYIDRH